MFTFLVQKNAPASDAVSQSSPFAPLPYSRVDPTPVSNGAVS